MNSIIDSDDIQYLDCYYEFERILDFAEEIIMKIIIGSSDNHINNIINNFFYSK